MWASHEHKHLGGAGTMTWQKNSSQVRTLLGAPKVSAPWTSRPEVVLLGVDTSCDRQLDLLDVSWEARLLEGSGRIAAAELKRNFFVDLSLSVSRRPWSHHLKAFRGKGHVYSFEADRCLDGLDILKMFGWPATSLRSSPPADLMNLAECAMSVQTTTLILLVYWCNPMAPWNAASAP